MSIESTRETMQRYFNSEHGDVSMMADDVVFTIMATGQENHGRDGVQGMLNYFYHIAFDATATTRVALLAKTTPWWKATSSANTSANLPASRPRAKMCACRCAWCTTWKTTRSSKGVSISKCRPSSNSWEYPWGRQLRCGVSALPGGGRSILLVQEFARRFVSMNSI